MKGVLLMEKTKEQHYTEVINNMLQRELEDLKTIVRDVEKVLKADLMSIDNKAIKVLEIMQMVRFNTEILRELQQMKR